MKVYLDDERATPDGWTRTFNPKDTIDLLKSGNVTDLSLDHDLGDDLNIGTGYDVLLWLEEQVFLNPEFPIPKIIVHSANSSAVIKMNLAITSITRIKQEKLGSHNQ